MKTSPGVLVVYFVFGLIGVNLVLNYWYDALGIIYLIFYWIGDILQAKSFWGAIIGLGIYSMIISSQNRTNEHHETMKQSIIDTSSEINSILGAMLDSLENIENKLKK